MNRICAFLLAVLCLTGCAAPNAAPEQEVLCFTYQNVKITPHAEAAPIISSLGEPKTYTEEASCAFEGMDKTYYYGSFYLATYPMEGKDYVYMLWFADDTVATEEGIRIGSNQADVESVYGADSFNGTNAYVLIKGNSKLMILITEGEVSAIRYEGMIQ
jgi:hypothetical protein